MSVQPTNRVKTEYENKQRWNRRRGITIPKSWVLRFCRKQCGVIIGDTNIGLGISSRWSSKNVLIIWSRFCQITRYNKTIENNIMFWSRRTSRNGSSARRVYLNIIAMWFSWLKGDIHLLTSGSGDKLIRRCVVKVFTILSGSADRTHQRNRRQFASSNL